MYSLYRIVNKKSDKVYIGITKVGLSRRFSQHKYSAKSGKKSKLYDAIRAHGPDSFSIELLETFDTQQEACNSEIELIAKFDNLYNLAAGGEGGFNITNVEEWKQKLRLARKGKKPFLGGKHSEETKRKCAEASAARWARERTKTSDLS